MKVLGIIPSRYNSSRFPGKPLKDILGKSMIERVYKQCKKSILLSDVIVATDDARILNHVLEFGGKAIMTANTHKSGTDRCNEVVQKLDKKYDLIINIQGDEPYINPLQFEEIINLFKNNDTQIGTLAKKIEVQEEIKSQNVVKAIFNQNKNATNFTRYIANFSSKCTYYKHIGMYAFKKEILKEVCNLPQSKNEIKEDLEQLRWLDNNYTIKIGITDFDTLSVDVPNDIEKIKRKMR